jgi:hypothetical protein
MRTTRTTPAIDFQVVFLKLELKGVQLVRHRCREIQGNDLHAAAIGADQVMAAGLAAHIGPIITFAGKPGKPTPGAQPIQGAVNRWATTAGHLARKQFGSKRLIGGGDPIQHCAARR